MNLLLFIVTIAISFIVVRIGAIAFELTGLKWSLAKFQALSCFSGTGFTTREAELIVGHPERRRIASFLMVLGNAGLVTLIATFANSLRPGFANATFTIPFIDVGFSKKWMPGINLFMIVFFMYFMVKISNNLKFREKLTNFLRKRLVKRELIPAVSFEELLVATGGYGVSNCLVTNKSDVAGKTLQDSNLRKYDVTLLAIERGGNVIPNPKAHERICPNDHIVCFGKLDNIREVVEGKKEANV